ncbi:hypothetical protein A0O28_0022730 [Trichoderma guizhouense]|uniref:Uncharacterized protein n=1 Tax=Trichoderma guizhouense TaxID=1491466 RepID=A0A1T3CSJ5_9HYPO|nr:hypothetical protein A0O28_0022730 [Trichoderma guizhouense]
MDSPPPEDNILELMSNLDKTQLEKLWKLRKLTSLNEDQVQELQKLHYLLELGGLIDLAKKVPYNIHDLCKRRDNNMCCFTGMLEMFWDPDTVTQLVPLIRDRNFMESPQNLISMNGQLHTWFDDCKMALKPIGETENGVVVQFHWLREGNYKPNSVGADFGTFTTQSGINQGQTFTLESDNPAHRPNFQLLKISWDLRRVAAICGAAVGEPWEESDDEKYMDYYSEDETCSSFSEENNYPEVLRWREEVEGGIEIETDDKTEADVEIETDAEMETDEDGQPGDNFEGPSLEQGTTPDQQVMARLKMPCAD